MQARKGRKPVRCGGEGVPECSKATAEPAQQPATPLPTENPSLTLAMKTKEALVALGWAVTGKAGGGGEHLAWASISASRGTETLIMNWRDGELVRQEYSLWDAAEDPETLPGRDLDFDPAELTDGELVQLLRGMKVTWWNSLANSAESAIVSQRLQIEHIFDQGDTHDSSKRIVKFIDHGGGGFRAFHVDALLKIG